MRVLLAEDDDLLGDGLKAGLKQEGYTVDWVKDGISAENALLDNEFDLVVLDEIKVGGCKILQAASTISHQCHRFEEDFGQSNRRAAVQIHSAVV